MIHAAVPESVVESNERMSVLRKEGGRKRKLKVEKERKVRKRTRSRMGGGDEVRLVLSR